MLLIQGVGVVVVFFSRVSPPPRLSDLSVIPSVVAGCVRGDDGETMVVVVVEFMHPGGSSGA